MLDKLIDEASRAVPLDATLVWLAEVANFDRYQASLGIMQAAEVVVRAAHHIGLSEVTMHRFAADGQARFWTFQSPVSWTPTRARLEIAAPDGMALVLDHTQQPFLVATYSAATPPEGVRARIVRPGAGDLCGAIALCAADEYSNGSQLQTLIAQGALGFITDAFCTTDPDGTQFSGRVELDSATTLFGLCVTTSQWHAIAALSECGTLAHLTLDVDRSASMPAVTAVIRGSATDGPEPEEVWLTAHLCHPRPGANDNASGVAALLGTAATLRALAESTPAWIQRRTIRFVWAPEFVGTAAVLHARQHAGGARPWPQAVLNMDMVGEDQALCECPFVVERSLESDPTLMVPLAERIVDEVFRRTAKYPGRWRAVPFLGYSDHALFAGVQPACPTVQFTHWPDRFNHSAADTLDKVSPIEMRRAITAATVLMHCVANDYQPVRAQLPIIVDAWCRAELVAVDHLERAPPPRSSPNWIAMLRHHVCVGNERLLSLLDGRVSEVAQGLVNMQGAGIARHWMGPINLRAMMAELSPSSRATLTKLVKDDKRTLAFLTNFALRANGKLTHENITAQTSFAFRRPLDQGLAEVLLSALFESGWLVGPDAAPVSNYCETTSSS